MNILTKQILLLLILILHNLDESYMAKNGLPKGFIDIKKAPKQGAYLP
jgi:hypothetical protein